jgi:hypothetical protein
MKEALHQAFLKAVAVEDGMYRYDYAASIIALVAERISDNDESGALWAASDIIRQTTLKAEEELQELRAIVFTLKQKAPEGKKRGRPAKKVK